jgi:UDP-glucose:(glucosyl)LPS alpha-1,2-glucosyltransferase
MMSKPEFVISTPEPTVYPPLNLDPTTNATLDDARSGTELMRHRLFSTVDRALLEQVQIIVPARIDTVLLTEKPKILWVHDLAHDPAVQHLSDPLSAHQFHVVCVSYWQQQQYLMQFTNLDATRVMTIKNAIPYQAVKFASKKLVNGRWQLIYTPTPHRGLGVLVAAVQILVARGVTNFDLHVCSSFDIYGSAWDSAARAFEPLFDECRNNPRIVYHGTLPNADVRNLLQEMHAFVYPSIYPETSCLCAIEALASGCLTVTTPLGALPETCGDWAQYLPLLRHNNESLSLLANTTAMAIENLINRTEAQWASMQNWLETQGEFFSTMYRWDARAKQWSDYIQHILQKDSKS